MSVVCFGVYLSSANFCVIVNIVIKVCSNSENNLQALF